MQRLIPSAPGHFAYYEQCLVTGGYKLDTAVSKLLPEGEIYVEDNLSTQWHRHVEQHGPKPEAYAAYTIALMALEERNKCLK